MSDPFIHDCRCVLALLAVDVDIIEAVGVRVDVDTDDACWVTCE
jgi:hypothetical protein